MITITSPDNPVLKQVKKLRQHAYRTKAGLTLLEGERLVWDSVRFGANLHTVLLREGYQGRIPACTHTFFVAASLFDSVAETETPQGILATADIKWSDVDVVFRGGLVVACDRVQDPGNLGTIIRLCHSAGADGIVLSAGTVDPFSTKVVRASMGSCFALPIARVETLKHFPGYTAFAGILDENARDLYDVSFPKSSMLILGNEGEGVSEEVIKETDVHVKIPMPGGTESLNVGIAGAIMVYEYVRQVYYV